MRRSEHQRQRCRYGSDGSRLTHHPAFPCRVARAFARYGPVTSEGGFGPRIDHLSERRRPATSSVRSRSAARASHFRAARIGARFEGTAGARRESDGVCEPARGVAPIRATLEFRRRLRSPSSRPAPRRSSEDGVAPGGTGSEGEQSGRCVSCRHATALSPARAACGPPPLVTRQSGFFAGSSSPPPV